MITEQNRSASQSNAINSPPGPPQPDSKLHDTNTMKPGDHTNPVHPSTSNAPGNSRIGSTLGKYQVTAILGLGGMGVVYRAHDPLIERDVAIKLLPEDLAEDDTALPRFLAEAKAAGKLSHPNVVSIYEIGQQDQSYFLVMELVPGGSIADALQRQGAFSVLNATRIVSDTCRGIAAAHSVGLIHRDIKPGNLLQALDGTIKVNDFGLVKATSSRDRSMTQIGQVVGTPYFMSPEQCEAGPVDARSDIYSLGATYYSLLTGKNPYDDSTSIVQVMYAQCQGPIPDPRLADPSIPPACAAIIARAMAKSPAERYQTANEMLADLQTVAATLSGAVHIALPSQSGSRPAASASALPAPQSTATQSPAAPSPARQSRRFWIAAAACGVTAIIVGTAFWKPGVTSSGKAATPAVAAIGDQEPIKVGVLHSMSGTMAGSETVVVDATLLAIDEINQAGGLLGRRVKPVVVDGRSDPQTFVGEAVRLIREENVCTVFGCWTSASRKAVKPVFEDHDHLLIYPLQYEGLEESPNIMYMGAAPNQQIIPALDWAMTTLKKKRFFLVGSDYVFPRSANAIIKDYLKSKGAEVVGEEYLPLGGQNTTAMTEAIVKAKPDMILNSINGDSNTAFFRNLRAAGVTPATIPSLSFSLAEQELRSLNIADMEGDYAAWTYFESVDTPENKQFVQHFRDKYPQRVISDPMEAAYVGVKIWAQAVTTAQSLEPVKIRRAMLNLRFDAPSGNTRIDPDTQHCYKTPRVGQIRADGQFNIIWQASSPVAPMPYPTTRTAAEWRAFLHDLNAGWAGKWSAP